MWRRRTRSGLLVLIAGASLYLLLPSLLAVFASWRSLAHLDWRFAPFVLVSEAAAFACIWELYRIALHVRDRVTVAAAQLAGNAAGRVLPGGGATATAVSVSMLRTAGVDAGDAVAGLTAANVLQIATKLALPVLALPAILGGAPVDRSLATSAYLGLVAVVLLLAAGAAAFTSDAPLELFGRAAQWLLNATVRRRRPIHGLSHALLAGRDFVRRTVGAGWRGALLFAVASTAFDYGALLFALRSVGTHPQPSLVLIAYASSAVLALVPFTPGGLGFVEAGLVGALTLAGVSASDAVAATLLYRLVSYWLPLPAGAAAYVLFRRRSAQSGTTRPESGATMRQ